MVLGLILFRETQCRRIDAEAHTGRRGPVGEDVPQMSMALPADHFRPRHAVRPVGLRLDFRFVRRRAEAWPARARIEFRVRLKKRLATADALICAGSFCFPKFAGKGRFRAFAARDVILLRSQLRSPLRVCFQNFIAHRASTTTAPFYSMLRSPAFALAEASIPIRFRATALPFYSGIGQAVALLPSGSIARVLA